MSKVWTAKDMSDFESQFAVECKPRADGMYDVYGYVLGKGIDIRNYVLGYSISDLRDVLPPIHTLHCNFDCVGHNIQNLKGSPLRVTGYFNVENNKLTSIDGAPEYIKFTFYLRDNKDLILTNSDLERYPTIECDPSQVVPEDPNEFIERGILPI